LSSPIKFPIFATNLVNREIADPTLKTRITDGPLKSFIVESPRILNIEYNEVPQTKGVVEDPNKVIEKKAARLIVIRRRKMKRHQLKKLRVKMKFEWAKIRQRREMAKEKAFQGEIMEQIRAAEKFSAAAYATQKIDKANEVLIPKLWRGKRLPEFVIKDLLEKKKRKQAEREADAVRRSKMNLNASDYKL
jgi:hypothetical protein